jgi:predicted nicotinamide N-methyase
LADDLPQPDLILAADCVYYEPAFPLLVQTLSDLVVDGMTEVLFCYKKRRKVESQLKPLACVADAPNIRLINGFSPC